MGGYTQQMISKLENGRSAASVESLVAAAKALEVSTDYLVGLADDSTPSAPLATALAEERARVGVAPAVLPADGEGPSLLATRPVAVVELAAAAGGGTLVDEERVAGRVWFRRDWLDAHDLDPRECRLLGVRGESMEPTLPDGCSILANRSHSLRREGRLFVVRTEDGLIVKRLGMNAAGGWLLVSDHPDKTAWPTVPWPAGAVVVGEVVWSPGRSRNADTTMTSETLWIGILLAGGGALAAAALIALGLTGRWRPVTPTTPPSFEVLASGACVGMLCILFGGILLQTSSTESGEAQNLTMIAACHDAASYIDNLEGFVGVNAAEALEALGYPFEMVFEKTPWAEVGVSFSWEATDRDDLGVAFRDGRRLHRYQENARYRVAAAGIPGGLEGLASCTFVRDVDTGEFWFWTLGDGTWLVEDEPQVRVVLSYNENLRLLP